MKKFGRLHRPFYRICAIDQRTQRDGKVIEELGTYDPMVPDVDARAVLNGERVRYWLSVGAQPSDKVSTLIKKYGEGGTHLEKQQAALARLAQARRRPEPMTVAPKRTKAAAAEEAAEEPAAEESPSE
ncbi:MAG: 30S ribosomal protein S16 [Pirellulales bacterium]|nr:30S ribosomal protein S16 [Pirellulales bacterium]